ncbi:MAG TPA: primosomal protein N', partial [Candidatus Limnocylindria bacterium]|nr:primosomal protein N' [Candidatus Limnocylindria bacterium]
MSFAQVAFPLPLRQTFAYRVPDHLASGLTPGVQVQVPFRGRTRRGIVVELSQESSRESVKEIAAVVGEPLLSVHLLALTRWVADYYLAPWGEVLAAALPGGQEGLAKSRARRAASEDRAPRLALPERIVLTTE